MAYGLTGRNGAVIKLKNIECDVSVTYDIVLCTLDLHYENCNDYEVYGGFDFPMDKDITIIDFSVRVGVEKLEPKIVPRDIEADNGFCFDVDKIPSDAKIIVEVKFLTRAECNDERVRIKIPLLTEQKFIPSGEQFTFDSYLNVEEFPINLNFIYHGKGVKNITSPTHNIVRKIGGSQPSAHINGEKSSASEIIIDVHKSLKDATEIYTYHDIMGCFFKPRIDRFSRGKNDWLFMIDITDKNGGEKYKMVCDMLEVTLRGLPFGDRFNVIIMKEKPLFLSSDFLPVTDESLHMLSDWLLSFDLSAKAEFYSPIRMVYRFCRKCTAVVLSDGGAVCDERTFNLVRNTGYITFYCLSIGSGRFTTCLKRLSAISGGRTEIIPSGKRFDDEFIRAFNIISSPYIGNMGIAFDQSVEKVTPSGLPYVHYGDSVSFTAKFESYAPNNIKVRGTTAMGDKVWNISFKESVTAGIELYYFHIKQLLEEYTYMMRFDGSNRDAVLGEKIINLAKESGIICPLLSYCLTDSRNGSKQIINPEYYDNAGDVPKIQDGSYLKRVKSLEHFINMAKSQCADGSFRPPYMDEDEDASSFTSDTVYDFMMECNEPEMFFWHIRKAVEYLLEEMEISNDPNISEKFGEGISLWYEKFGGNDKISQKAAALSFIHRGK